MPVMLPTAWCPCSVGVSRVPPARGADEHALVYAPLSRQVHAGRTPPRAANRPMTHQLDELEDVLNRIKGLSGGSLRITVATAANYVIPTLLGTFSRR